MDVGVHGLKVSGYLAKRDQYIELYKVLSVTESLECEIYQKHLLILNQFLLALCLNYA